ncbi:hypothetical protein [Campylobacter sp. VTCC 70190]|uniref:hypothetical protein n=1 Tax=Campylobacter sp. VTCC 70190 TaxID=3392118 RepID=UPI00398E3FE1
MKKAEFKQAFLTKDGLKFTNSEKRLFLELTDSLENLGESFLQELFLNCVSKYKFIYFKEFLELCVKTIENHIDKKIQETKIIGFDDKSFLQEKELLARYYKIKIFKILPKWFNEIV